jgi:uncharacterized membrane protein
VFPIALVVLGLFLAYQVYRLATVPSVWLGALTVVDAAIVVLVAREWRVLPRAGETKGD